MRPHFSPPESDRAPATRTYRPTLLLLLLVCVGLWSFPRLYERFEGFSLSDLSGLPIVGALFGASGELDGADTMGRIQHLLDQQKAAQAAVPEEQQVEPLVLVGAAGDLTPEQRERLLREAEANRPRVTRGPHVGTATRAKKVVN